ncbi:DUF6629 family protein [Nocardioides sp.]|uniref:DUF6629 family protein n=1 Tax=Nocardioides sp. TaxID=35761 RepID=UPI0031FF3355|nr:hypothetical protein [Nocardioides sp.]
MCFSVEADLIAGVALLPVGVLALREVRHPREVPFASLPLLFALHQLVEALVWAGASGDVSDGVQRAAALAYVLFALPVLPTLVPLAVLMLEPRDARLRVAPFVALGLVVSAYLTVAVLQGPVEVRVHAHALAYGVGLENVTLWTVLYIAAVIGPSLLSGYPSIVAFGVLNLVGLTVVALLYREAFASLWCVYAACTSVLIVLHMVLRRRLTDPQRLQGQPNNDQLSGSTSS